LFSPPPHCRKNEKDKTGSASASHSNDQPDPEDSTKELDLDKLEHDDKVVEGTATDAQALMSNRKLIVTEEELWSAHKIKFKARNSLRYKRISAYIFNGIIGVSPGTTW
jgi:hypothetical protein